MGFADKAKEYYDMGFSIMPIKKGDKKPMLPWEEYQTKRASMETVLEWCKIYPEANIAIITGKVSGNLVVLDVDGPKGVESLKKLHIPPTLIAKTGKGTHYYFRMPPGSCLRNATRIFPEVDVRGEGGYVVAPGSVHESGAKYEWIIEEPLADCPAWLPKQMDSARARATAEPAKKTRKELVWLEKIKKGVKSGGRNDACARLAGYYSSKGYEDSDIMELLLSWNKRNEPPLPDLEIVTTLRSITQAERNREGRPITGVKPTTLKDCKATISKWLYHKDDSIIDVALAVVASTHHTGDPLWIMFVGAPSSGKTEIMRGFDKHKDVYFIDRVSPATFVTGFTKAKGILERMGPEPKTFVLQDFSTILSKPPYDRMEIVDTLRQIYNGSYHNEWGNGKRFTWRGKIALLAGATPDIEAHGIAMGELGERFMYYRIEADDDDTRGKMMERARAMEGKEKEVREEIARALHGVIAECSKMDITNVKIEGYFSDWLYNLVDLTTSLRSIVKRNQYRREIIEYTPHKEGPGRMYKACQVLMKSLAVVRGRTAVNEDDYAIAVKICADSIQSIRREALRALRKTYGRGGVRPKAIAELTGYQSTESIGYHLADLSALGLVDRWLSQNKGLSNNAPFLYEMSQKTYEKLEKCGMMDII